MPSKQDSIRVDTPSLMITNLNLNKPGAVNLKRLGSPFDQTTQFTNTKNHSNDMAYSNAKKLIRNDP